MEIYVKISFISIFSLFFLVFKHDLIRCIDFTRIAASNTASDDDTNRSHRIFNTDLIYSYAHFIVKIAEKIMTVFNTI